MVEILRHSSVKHQVICWSHANLHLWSSYPALCQFLHDKHFFISQFQNLSSWLFSLPLLYLSVGFLPPKSSSFQVCIPTILSHSLELSHHYLPEAKCPIHPISVSYRLETSLITYSADLSHFHNHHIWPTIFSKPCYEEASVQDFSPIGK